MKGFCSKSEIEEREVGKSGNNHITTASMISAWNNSTGGGQGNKRGLKQVKELSLSPPNF